MNSRFLLLHGYGGTCETHWQTYLAKHLKSLSAEVLYPLFPDPDHPDLEAWARHLEELLGNPPTLPLVVAGHSLGCSLWLHYAARHPEVQPIKVFLVAPPFNDCGIDEIASFFPLPKPDLSGQDYQIIGSNDDPYIAEYEFKELSEALRVPFTLIPNAGHINAPMHGDWEWMNEECGKWI